MSNTFPKTISEVRKRLIQMHYESGVGHIGGNLSCLDILMVLNHQVLQKDDLFVLSKGHSAGALYVTLWSLGKLSEEDLKTFHKENTKLSGHPAPSWREEVLFATGSLGHGLSLSSGLALAKKLNGETGRVFCLTSDGEWQEGSNWEALLFANHHGLNSITLIVDWNGLQGFGSTKEVGNLDPFADKFRSFGWDVEVVNGHDHCVLKEVMNHSGSSPRVILARTHKGRGVSFMEDKMEWHYRPLTETLYRQALEELERE